MEQEIIVVPDFLVKMLTGYIIYAYACYNLIPPSRPEIELKFSQNELTPKSFIYMLNKWTKCEIHYLDDYEKLPKESLREIILTSLDIIERLEYDWSKIRPREA